jgi:hypothetical protein
MVLDVNCLDVYKKKERMWNQKCGRMESMEKLG